jgi:hypothetical protein
MVTAIDARQRAAAAEEQRRWEEQMHAVRVRRVLDAILHQLRARKES